MNSTLLRREVLKTSKRLMDALAEERRVNSMSADDQEHATVLEYWKKARGEVECAVGHYAVALDNYREALFESVLSELGRRKPGSPQTPKALAESRKQERLERFLIGRWRCPGQRRG